MTVLTRGAVAYPGSSLDFHTGTWREERPIHVHTAAPCHGACPAGEDAQAYIAKLQEGDAEGAWRTLVMANPLPAVTGRVCDHPCESACNRGKFDEAIAIHSIERYLGDRAIAEGWAFPVGELPAEAPEIAVVGAGPAGLAAAYHLRRLGHKVTVFDQDVAAGGLCRTAIPIYRLPRDTLDAEIGRILDLGIEFRPHQRLGRDMRLEDLQQEYAAVFLGVGCNRHRDWSVDGAVPSGLHEGLDLLKEWISLGAAPADTRRVLVQGGGNTAVDVARMLRRAGATEVHVVSASALPDDPEAAPNDKMAALPREVAQAQEEGVVFHPYKTLNRLVLREGKLTAVEVATVRKLPGDGGRSRRVTFEGTEQIIEVDDVVPAIGEIVDPEGVESVLGRGNFFQADRWGLVDGSDGVFVGGDATANEGTVTAAVGDGRRAAEAIARYVRGEKQPAAPEITPIDLDALTLRYFDLAKRQEPSVLPVEARTGEDEIEAGLDTGQIKAEVLRCFSCGNCLACDNCWTLCPDSAVLKTRELASDGSHYVFDYEYCKGCGLCAAECPPGYIKMIEEGVGGAG